VTEVQFIKKRSEKIFIIVDGAMNDAIRPSLYESYHEIEPVRIKGNNKWDSVDIVGPICESGDFLGKDRKIEELKRGDYLAMMSAGAYLFTMSSNYNSRPRSPEVLVSGKDYHIIRKRESIDSLFELESIPEHLK